MKRRAFVVGMAAVMLGPSATPADQLGTKPLIGFLGSTDAAAYAPAVTAVRAGLREKGYEEGKNIVVEYRWAQGATERYPALVTELLHLKPLLIVSECGLALDVIRKLSGSVPVIVGACADPVHFSW